MRCWQEPRPFSPIWQFPGFTLKVVKLDWLRIVDLGCAADCAGNILLLLQSKMLAPSISASIALLFKEILAEYSVQNVSSDRLATLTETMIRKNATSPPKLKAKRCRNTTTDACFGRALQETFGHQNAVEAAAKACLSNLLQCYAALEETPYSPDYLEANATRFALQYSSLCNHFDDGFSWRVKPKFHLFMHLAKTHTNPRDWTYRDEDLGGAAASMVRAKGGWNTPANSAQNVLDKFRARNSLPVLC